MSIINSLDSPVNSTLSLLEQKPDNRIYALNKAIYKADGFQIQWWLGQIRRSELASNQTLIPCAIMTLSQENCLKVMKQLLASGVNPNTCSAVNQHTSLMYAILKHDTDAVKMLIPHLSKENINLQDGTGKTALMYAITHTPSVVEDLLAHPDIDLGIKDDEGRTAQDYIAFQKDEEIQNKLRECFFLKQNVVEEEKVKEIKEEPLEPVAIIETKEEKEEKPVAAPKKAPAKVVAPKSRIVKKAPPQPVAPVQKPVVPTSRIVKKGSAQPLTVTSPKAIKRNPAKTSTVGEVAKFLLSHGFHVHAVNKHVTRYKNDATGCMLNLIGRPIVELGRIAVAEIAKKINWSVEALSDAL